MAKLAIEGGTPVCAARYTARHHIDATVRDEIVSALERGVLSAFYGTPRLLAFESEFAAYHGIDYGVATNSGTAALHVAYAAVGVGPGDEVIVPANAYISAATAALQLNAIPIFADIDPVTFVLDPTRLSSKISNRTRAIVPVHLYGQPADMPALMKIAAEHGVAVVEDCAQGHGARVGGRLVGSFGHASCYSLCCRKHVFAGEGGIVITNDRLIADTARSLVNKGKGLGWWDYHRMGYSYLMTDVQAILASASLKALDAEIARRRDLAALYRELLADSGLELAREVPGYVHIYFKLPFLLPQAAREHAAWFERAVQAENVIVERSYPILYTIPWIQRKEGVGDGTPYRWFEHGRALDYSQSGCHVAEDVCSRLFAACTGPGITEREVRDTAAAILKVFEQVGVASPSV